MAVERYSWLKRGLPLAAVVLTGLVALFAILIAVPQPSLSYDNDIVPMARQYRNLKSNSKLNDDKPLKGVVAVITGGTSGTGLGLTQVLTKLGAHVVVLGRSPTKLQHMVQDLKRHQPNVAITTVVGDLEDLASVSRAADEITSSFPRIDILVNNGGIHLGAKIWQSFATQQGYDLVFGVNYLSHVLLTEKLIPKLLRSSRPRILQVSSSYHHAVDGSDLACSPSSPPIASKAGGSLGFYIYRTQRQYANSKLAQILHGRALLRRYPIQSKGARSAGTNVTWIRSSCSAWASTNVAGPPGTIEHWILSQFGYPVPGWGIASLLRAILSDDKYGDTEATTPDDHYVNTYWSVTMSRLVATFMAHPLLYKLGIRDAISNGLATTMLLTQKLFPYKGTALSSVESYDKELQDQLYQWSLDAIKSWL